jgi:V-type H+-transporting ATPase subunit a
MDSYGVSAYQEVNPGLFAIVTFPFLFAVMFGDIGHGSITLLAAMYMIIKERKLAKVDLGEVMYLFSDQQACVDFSLSLLALSFCTSPSFSSSIIPHFPMQSGRYIILLMGIFSIYTGFLYNDVFSKSLHLWHSAWEWPESNGTMVTATLTDHRYPFGLDPGWHGAENALVFTNSYKMKMSVVLGLIHVCPSRGTGDLLL